MAARFTKGDSIQSTRETSPTPGRHVEPRTKSHTLRSGSTMPGMPGFIETGANGKRGGNAQGGKSISPKWPPRSRAAGEGYIGHKGGGAEAKKLQRGGAGTQGKTSAWKGPSGGHRGRMERLSGSVKTFTERSKKSCMY